MCAPKAPDPKETSAAQTAANFMGATANTYAQNGDYTDVNGNSRTTNFTYHDVYDPYTGTTSQAVTPNVTERLSSSQQAILDETNKAKLGYGRLANSQLDKLQTTLKDPFSFNDSSHTQWATGLYDKINGQHIQDQSSNLDAKLANMGLHLGDPAYEKAKQSLMVGQDQSRNQFLLDSYGQDFQTQQAIRNQNVNETTALATGAQVAPTQFGTTRAGTTATTDNAGIINSAAQLNAQAAGANSAAIGGALSGIGSMFAAPSAGTIGSALLLSDKRAKTDIEKVGKANGQNVYKYRYKGGGPMQLGLMAQDVEKKMPSAVVTGADGLKRVNYAKALRMGA